MPHKHLFKLIRESQNSNELCENILWFQNDFHFSKEVAEQYPSYVSKNTTGAITPKKEPMQYTGERKLLGIAAMHKSNLVPVFEDDKQYAKDLARMRR